MREDLEQALCRDFPNLYKNRDGSIMETAMCWGFECGDGWEPIIRELSAKLEKMILSLPEEDREHCCAAQVKEKYGTLRFYMHFETDEMTNAISYAEHRSACTCEICGKPGKSSVKNHWVSVRCPDCK